MADQKQSDQACPLFNKKLDLRSKKNRRSVVQALQTMPNLFSFATSEIGPSLEFAVINLPSVEWRAM